MKRRMLISIIFSAVLLTGAAVCLICDLAISGGLTWALIPASSIAFAWLVLLPCLCGKRGAAVGMVLLSVLLVPYLLLLSGLTGVREVYAVGAPISAVSIVFLWAVAAIFSRVGKTGAAAALGRVFVLAVPFVFAVNVLLSKLIGEPVVDIWDMLTVLLLLILACVCFVCGKRKRTE